MSEANHPADVVAFGVYEANLRTGELRRSGIRIKLQEKPFQVLSFLLEKRGDLVTRDELRERLWAGDTFVDFDHGLNTAVNKLREVLGDSAANPRFIETLPRRGYRFVAEVRQTSIPGRPVPSVPLVGSITEPENPVLFDLAGTVRSSDLPSAPRSLLRALLSAIQVGYLAMYIAALHSFSRNVAREQPVAGFEWLPDVLVWVAVIAIPIRLYLLFALGFDYSQLSQKFARLFPFLFLLDELWALSPFWVHNRLGIGLAFFSVAAFVYLPFAQRTLMWMSYGKPAVTHSTSAAS